MIGKLTTIMLIVKDMDRSVAFYRDVVGLKLEMQSPEWSSLSAGNITLGLHPESQYSKVSPTLGCTFGFEVSDIQTVVQQLKSKGAAMMLEPIHEDFGWLGIFTDPDGYPVQLVQLEAQAKKA
ncbi:MAG TPA: VOC family protein [Terriglobales bacterium]|jgi:predicted enzyme related to lactoylglutathione lyase|nr:VOC family protein [Terriglobales bacterium]